MRDPPRKRSRVGRGKDPVAEAAEARERSEILRSLDTERTISHSRDVNLLASQLKLALSDLLKREGVSGRVLDKERADGSTMLAVILTPADVEPLKGAIRTLLEARGVAAKVEDKVNPRGERVIGVLFE